MSLSIFCRSSAVLFNLLLLFIFTACATTTSPHYFTSGLPIYDVVNKDFITLDDFINLVEEDSLIILGEEHNSVHQAIELEILKRLERANKLGSISLEMLPSGFEIANNSSLSPATSTTLKEVRQLMPRWRWDSYKALISFLLPSVKSPKHHPNYTFKGANLSDEEMRVIYEGAYPLNGNISTTKEVQEKIAALIINAHKDAHKKIISTSGTDMLVTIQQFKDRRMAESMLKGPRPSILIAGRYHASKDVGAPLHLEDLGHPSISMIFLKDLQDARDNEANYIYIVR